MLADTSNFLLPNATIIPEFLAFLCVLGVVAWKVLPPVNKAIESRQRSIAESLQVIDEAKQRQANAESEAHRVVDEARQQARTVIDNANRVSEQLQAEARRRGEEEYNRIVARAQSEIERSRRQSEAELSAQLADLVVRAAERVVSSEIDASRHRALIDEAIASVANDSDAASLSAAEVSSAANDEA